MTSSLHKSKRSNTANDDHSACTKQNLDYQALVKDANILKTAKAIAKQINQSSQNGSEKNGNEFELKYKIWHIQTITMKTSIALTMEKISKKL